MRRAALARTRAQTRPVRAALAGLLIAMALFPTASPGQAETMSSALVRAYAGNPDLNQQRAGVRATDENLPRATAAWRPPASATGQFSYNYLDLITSGTAGAGAAVAATGGTGGSGGSGGSRLRKGTDPGTLDLTVTQNLFNGNRTVNGVRQAESNIFGARESLRNTEQNVLLNGATAYMDVLRDTAILDLRKNNIIVLEEQLRQTRDRFIVGEVTRTDVAQAESSLATGRSDYFTAQANLQTSIANYRQVIGVQPTRLEPARTIESLLPRSLGSAVTLALAEHPGVQATLHAMEQAGRGRTLSDSQSRWQRSAKLQSCWRPGRTLLQWVDRRAGFRADLSRGRSLCTRAASKGKPWSSKATGRFAARSGARGGGFRLGSAR